MAKDKSAKMTKAEKSWIMYDWANSVYATNIMAAILPIYFSAVCGAAGQDGDIWWGYGTSIATAVVAVLAPILGAFGDRKGMKKKFLGFFIIIGVLFTASMAFTDNWRLMLVGYIISYIGFAGANVFYDSFLTDVTTDERMDRISAWGYAMGYIGGSTIPFIGSIIVLLVMGMDNPVAVKITILITAIWWAIFSLPILFNVKQEHYDEDKKSVGATLKGLVYTLKDIFKNKPLFFYIIAYFFYIDGVNTVIHMATSYGSTIGLNTVGMILALLVTQIVAVPFSLIFSKLSAKFGSLKIIGVGICMYILICGVGFFMGQTVEAEQIPLETRFVQEINAEADEASQNLTEDASKEYFDKLVNDETEGLIVYTQSLFASSDRKQEFADYISEIYVDCKRAEGVSSSEKLSLRRAIESLEEIGTQFLSDENMADYDKAVATGSILFWILAFLVGTVQGGIQALSRSYFGKLVPAEKSNEYFGFFDIFGKFACVIGPALYSAIRQATNRPSIGLISLVILFAIGGILLIVAAKAKNKAEA